MTRELLSGDDDIKMEMRHRVQRWEAEKRETRLTTGNWNVCESTVPTPTATIAWSTSRTTFNVDDGRPSAGASSFRRLWIFGVCRGPR